MEWIRSGFDFIFSSYKRAAAVLFIFALVLAIPITVNFLGQRQDIRQRAQEFEATTGVSTNDSITFETNDSLGCVQKPSECNDLFGFLNYGCNEPAGGWCPQAITPTPSQTGSNDCNFFNSLIGGCYQPTPTPTPQVISCVQCASPPPDCTYVGGSCQSCGTLVCQSLTPTPTCTPVPPICIQEGQIICSFLVAPAGGWCPVGGTYCTQDAKACPDGSFVGRVGPNCEFAPCPGEPTPSSNPTPTCTPRPACLDWPDPCDIPEDPAYCPKTTPTCIPRPSCLDSIPACKIPDIGYCPPSTITPIVTGSQCALHSNGDANCDGKINTDDFNIWRDEFLGLTLGSNSPKNRSDFNNDGIINTDDFNIWRDGFISGSSLTCGTIAGRTCPPGYSCQLEGNYPDAAGICVPIPPPPVVSCNAQPDANGACPDGCVNYGVPLGCITQEYADYCNTHSCPICLSQNSKILTPQGEKNVQDLKTGDKVYSADSNGKKVAVSILKTAKTYVGQDHKILHIVLSDNRSLYVSPGHPTAQGIDVAMLKTGNALDGGKIVSIELLNYKFEYTYDLLPESQTGTYYANGILMGSTLKRSN